MRQAIAWTTALALVACLALAGCDEEKKTAGDPPIRLGLAPGEAAPYEPAPPTPPAPAAPTDTAAAPAAGEEPVATEASTASTVTTPSGTETTAVERMYTIRKGDTLIGLARRYYNDQSKWKDIWNANRDTIANPNVIKPGLEIRLP